MEARTGTEQRRTAVLIPHPDTPQSPITAIELSVMRTSLGIALLDIQWRVRGDLARLNLPAPVAGRVEGLWRTTCLEAFFRIEGEDRYFEFNASPTDGWATFAFDGYREGMRPAIKPMAVERRRESKTLVVDAAFDLDETFARAQRGRALHLGLSAVIEDVDGSISYWALAHPPGKPDFHHPDSFALILPPPETA